MTEALEFHKVYGLSVVAVPTHRPGIRKNNPAVIFLNRDSKLDYLVEEVMLPPPWTLRSQPAHAGINHLAAHGS